MESLSRPFSKKLANGNSFSAYDGVFSGGTAKFGAPTKYSSGIEDYGEIFGGASYSRPSSIPILDISSALDEAKVSADATRSSKLDYSKIFGGFRDEDIAASYEELFSKPKGAKKLSGEARTPAETASPSNGSGRLNRYKEEGFQGEAPNQSFEGLKQFNMSYHKTNQTSNDGTNGTTHIAQLRAVPGFTRFIGENPPLQKAEGDKSVPPPKVDANLSKKQNTDGIGRFKSQSHLDKFCPSDKSFFANENSPKTPPPKMSSPSSKPANVITNKREPKRSMDLNFKVPGSESSKADPADCSPSFSDEEIDVNSAAAASAAALRKALDKAQASIRIAKELMERKKDGPQRFSKSSSKDGLDVRKRREDKVTVEASRIREKNAKETCENADVVLQVFTKSEREKARRSGKVAPDFKEREKIFVIEEVSGEKTGINLESTEGCEAPRQFSELADTGECRAATPACKHADGSNEVMLSVDTQCGKDMETGEKILEQLDGNDKKVDGEAQESEDLEGKLNVVKMAQDWAQNVHRLDTTQEVHDQEESEKVGVGREDEETEMKQKAISGQEKCEKKLEESLVVNENEEFGSQEGKANNNEEVVDVAQECMEGDKKQGEVFEKEQKNKPSIDVHKEESENRLKRFGEQAEIEHRLQAAGEWVDYEETCEVEIYEKRENDAHEGEDNEKNLDKINELDINNKRLTPDGEESEERQENNNDWEGKEEILVEACEYEETESIQLQTATESNETAEVNQEAVQKTMDFDATIDACEQDADERATTSHEVHRHEQNDNDLNFEDNERISDVSQSSCEFKDSENGLEEFEVAHELGEKEMCKTGGLVVGISEHIEIENKMKDATEALHFNDNPVTIGLGETNSGPKQTGLNEKESDSASNLGSVIKILECESGEGEKIAKDEIAFDLEEVESDFIDTALDERQSAEMGKKMEASQPPSMIKGEEEKTIGIDEEFKRRQMTEKNEENPNQTFAVEEKETKDTVQKEVRVEKENLSKNDEANKREREREKDRIAVERAIREARERAFAEARERAERAAVERATTEARQRVMAEAREKYEKASAATKSSVEKASMEAKLRAERAAVERATVEARERALEKALSQKSSSGAREQAEKYVAEKFSGLSRDNEMRPSIPPSDTQKSDGPSGESTERRQARLERHQRTMERAAKALAEKNKRDLLAQKEQADKNRLAETLDAEVKRWSSGKEGNLRALLSTLQYILGSDSSWQPISLTEIVTTSAVKKAYRKATLHVHPDKLQQRGASIQQKYICEKVFDLLKAAWNKFNYEER